MALDLSRIIDNSFRLLERNITDKKAWKKKARQQKFDHQEKITEMETDRALRLNRMTNNTTLQRQKMINDGNYRVADRNAINRKNIQLSKNKTKIAERGLINRNNTQMQESQNASNMDLQLLKSNTALQVNRDSINYKKTADQTKGRMELFESFSPEGNSFLNNDENTPSMQERTFKANMAYHNLNNTAPEISGDNLANIRMVQELSPALRDKFIASMTSKQKNAFMETLNPQTAQAAPVQQPVKKTPKKVVERKSPSPTPKKNSPTINERINNWSQKRSMNKQVEAVEKAERVKLSRMPSYKQLDELDRLNRIKNGLSTKQQLRKDILTRLLG